MYAKVSGVRVHFFQSSLSLFQKYTYKQVIYSKRFLKKWFKEPRSHEWKNRIARDLIKWNIGTFHQRLDENGRTNSQKTWKFQGQLTGISRNNTENYIERLEQKNVSNNPSWTFAQNKQTNSKKRCNPRILNAAAATQGHACRSKLVLHFFRKTGVSLRRAKGDSGLNCAGLAIELVDSKWIILENLQDFLQSSLTKNVFSCRTCKGNLQESAR